MVDVDRYPAGMCPEALLSVLGMAHVLLTDMGLLLHPSLLVVIAEFLAQVGFAVVIDMLAELAVPRAVSCLRCMHCRSMVEFQPGTHLTATSSHLKRAFRPEHAAVPHATLALPRPASCVLLLRRRNLVQWARSPGNVPLTWLSTPVEILPPAL